LLFPGQVQPVAGSNPRAEVYGAARGGFPVFQAHAGERPARHAPHGDAPREEKIVITPEWVASDDA